MRTLLIVALALTLICVGLGGWYYYHSSHAATTFRTVPVERGDLLATISATGTLQAEDVIDVGAQVNGRIKEFGPDPHDDKKLVTWNTVVEEGTVLARIDDALYLAALRQADAQLEQAKTRVDQAKANVGVAKANVAQARARLDQTRADYERSEKLLPGGGVAKADLEVSKMGYDTARAGVVSADAALVQAQAAVPDAEAAVKIAQANRDSAQTNVDYTVIKSPVKGVVIDRRVNIGQTVVSSLNAPSLFLLAKDLKRLQVWASVNEADIGQIDVGQTVKFTVDAHPNEVFKGTVSQVRLNATMTQNVVTYTVVVDTNNSTGKLKPYETANLQFEVSKRTNVLLVPNAALRWRPQVEQVVPEERDAFAKSMKRKESSGATAPARQDKAQEKPDRATVWVADGNLVRPVKVRIGLSDGFMTEIVKGDLEEGAQLVVGESRPGDDGGTTNPFTPKLFGGGKKQ
jgi:HlyD family secretion protein